MLLGTTAASALASHFGAHMAPALAQSGKMQSWKLGTSRHTAIHDLAHAPDGGIWFHRPGQRPPRLV